MATGTLTTPGVETVNITTVDSVASGTQANTLSTVTLTDSNATTINLSGNNGIALTHTGTALQTFNASGVTQGAVTFTAGVLTNAATVTGTAKGGDTLNFNQATAAVTMTATAGSNALTGAATVASTITGGTGADTIIGGSAVDTINGGAGNDIITGAAGADNITLGAGNDIIRYGASSTSTSATGANVDNIRDFNTANDRINLTGAASPGLTTTLNGVTIDTADAATATMGAVIVSATNVDTIAQVYTALGTSLAAMAGSAADGTATVAQVVTFTAGTSAGTYLVINDATTGFNGANDIVVNLTGMTGTFVGTNITYTV